MFIGSALCHQLPERPYFIGDLQMPLCARCIGIHFGFLLSAAILFVAGRRYVLQVPSMKRLLVLGAIMMVFFVDSGLSYSGISQSDNLRRTLSGVSLGVPLAFFAMSMLANIPLEPKRAGTPITDVQFFAVFASAFIAALASTLASESALALFVAVSVAGLAGMFVLYSTLISLGVQIYTDGRAWRRDRVLMISSVVALILIVLFAAAR